MTEVLEKREIGNLDCETTIEFPSGVGKIFANITRKVTYFAGTETDVKEVSIQNEEIGKKLYEALKSKFDPWILSDTKSPEEEKYVHVKRNGRVYEEIMYMKNGEWFFWNGAKASKTWAKQIHHWKYVEGE